MSTILLATDFSPVSDHALDEAVALARGLGDDIEIIHIHEMQVASVPPTLDLAPMPPSAASVGKAETALTERVARIRAQGLNCESTALFGRPDEEVVRRAQQLKPRMVVVGAKGHSPLHNLLLGSIAERIVKKAPCPVLIVRPETHG